MIEISKEELDELRAKAARYDYISGHAKIASCKMNSQHSWRIGLQPFIKGTGPTFDDAIDESIRIQQEELNDLYDKYPEWPKLPNSK
jgi:hypothetical protein